MNKTYISAMENPFETEGRDMGHIFLSGKSGAGKTELIKQFIGSFLQSGKKVMWFSTHEEEKTLLNRWNAKVVEHGEALNATALSANKLILVKTTELDFVELNGLLMKERAEWVIVHENLDEVTINYEQNEYSTQKLDFLHFVSEFGRVFNMYTLVSCQDLSHMSRAFPAEKILENSSNRIFLQQSENSLKHAQKKNWLGTEHIEKVKSLPKYEAFFVQK